jgi:hypothetical protein
VVVRPGSLSLGILSFTLHAHPPQGVLKSHEPILPCSDGAFPTVQLPLPGEELHLQLVSQRQCCHHTWRWRRPTPINKRGSAPLQEAILGNHRHGVKPHLVNDEAQSVEVSRQNGGCRPSWLGPSPQGRLLGSPSLAITSNGAR